MRSDRIKKILGGLSVFTAISVMAFSAHANEFSGFGQDIPLKSAASQIVPDGWTVDYGTGVNQDTPVSWSSAKDWKTALSNAVSKKGYSVQFGSSSVIISKSKVASAPSAPAKQKPKATSSPRKETRSSKPAPRTREVDEDRDEYRTSGGGGFIITQRSDSSPSKASSRSRSDDGEWEDYEYAKKGKATKGKPSRGTPVGFTVANGDDLHAVLNEWASVNGWKVIWNSEFNYPIAASARFDGDFIQATTALIEAMHSVRPALTVEFFRGNKVVVISNSAADEVN